MVPINNCASGALALAVFKAIGFRSANAWS
jgi:hypothetical protein